MPVRYNMPMLTVGLTGNYGMGKSSVSSMFRKLGAAVIDSDAVVAEILQDRAVIKKIARMLGPEVIDNRGGINKRIVAEKVFSDSSLRKKLERLIHPLVLGSIDSEIRKIRKGVVIVEVPLLFEGNYQDRFDRTITIWTRRSVALTRLKDKGIPNRQASARMKAQMDIRTKKRLADYTIDNSGTRRETAIQVKSIYMILKNESVSKGQCRS